MGILDAILTNGDSVTKGFNAILGKQYYTIAYDSNNNVVCWFYDMGGIGHKLIVKYHEHNNLDIELVSIEKRMLKNKSYEVNNMLLQKICILKDKLVTYEVIVNLAKTRKIKGYKEGKLKKTLNKFEIIE